MSAIVLDTGALIALERNDRRVWAMLRIAADDGRPVVVPAGCIAQAWRGGSRQALLARALHHCDEVPLDGTLARAAGLVCGESETNDVVDASVLVVALGFAAHNEPVAVLTSDHDDLGRLLSGRDGRVRIVRV